MVLPATIIQLKEGGIIGMINEPISQIFWEKNKYIKLDIEKKI